MVDSPFARQLTKKVEEARDAQENGQSGTAIKLFEEIIKEAVPSSDDLNEETIKAKESATYALAKILADKGLYGELIQLQKTVLPLFIDFPKSKTAKIMRTMFDLSIEAAPAAQLGALVDLSKYVIDWCESESRTFLRMRIETYLSSLYFKLDKFNDALALLNKLNHELKKKEDKQLLVESQLVESKVYHALENLPKAKAALTAVKTIANSIYIVPILQAEIDMVSGLISADEKDYTTAYSYFYETFEGYRSMNELSKAGVAFKFMLFSKIMNRQSDDALNLINSAISLKFQNRSIEAMKEVGLANKQKNLLQFSKCATIYERELFDDLVIRRHFNYLYNNLLEDNLKKIILPYSEVQIDYIAKQIELPVDRILMKLSEMILDEKIKGTLDQGRNCLIVFEEEEPTEMFEHALKTFDNLDEVLDALYDKTQKFKEKHYS